MGVLRRHTGRLQGHTSICTLLRCMSVFPSSFASNTHSPVQHPRCPCAPLFPNLKPPMPAFFSLVTPSCPFGSPWRDTVFTWVSWEPVERYHLHLSVLGVRGETPSSPESLGSPWRDTVFTWVSWEPMERHRLPLSVLKGGELMYLLYAPASNLRLPASTSPALLGV